MKPISPKTPIGLLIVGAIALAGCGPAALPSGPVTIKVWHPEGEEGNAARYLHSLADAYTAAHPNVTFELRGKETEVLRQDFQTAARAAAPPGLLWTVNDDARPFALADLIVPVDDLVDLDRYIESTVAAVDFDGRHWGVPISNGNHLMLYYNKDFVPTPPADTDALLAMSSDLEGQGITPLVYNETDPLWLVPWLGGFGGSVFAEDDVTPTLNTPEMVATLAFLKQLRDQSDVPLGIDDDEADTLFKEGQAAMIVNGDWTLEAYKELFGDRLGVARIPTVSSTGTAPAPFTSGESFMIPSGLEVDTQAFVVDFIEFATDRANQLDMVSTLGRLPALKSALADESISGDPYLAGSADQMVVGVPLPTVVELRCTWDGMKPEMPAVLAGDKSPEDAAAAMQSAADACLANLD